MSRRSIALAVVVAILSALLVAVLASVARAGIICDIERKLGYDNVKDCESTP